MYRIAVCDDNREILTQVCTTLSGSPLGKELELTPFHSGAALAAALRSGARFALLILDIELDTVDGVAIGRLLREELRDSVTQLLYISGQQQYAMALFDTRPLNFLLKPLDEAKLLDCVVQAIRLSRPEEAVLTVLVERTPRALPTQAIRYIESYHKRITVHSVQHELVCRDKLHYDLTLTTIETTDDDRSVYAEALEAGLAETAQTFVDAAKDVQKSVSNETVLVVVTYFDAAGVELASQSFSSAD